MIFIIKQKIFFIKRVVKTNKSKQNKVEICKCRKNIDKYIDPTCFQQFHEFYH